MAKAQLGYYHGMNKARFESFSDSVFAFAITLLILGIALPAQHVAGERQLRDALIDLWPNAIAFALSFAVIGIMWQNHHALFRFVDRVDRTTVALNLALLAGTVFIPFASTTLGTYPAMRPSAFLYGLVLSYCAIMYNVLLHRLIRQHAFAPGVTAERLRATVRAYFVGLGTYLAATLIALAVPLLSIAAYLLIAGFYVIPHGVDSDAA
jgi:uncharacterized membrane protein